MGVTIETSSVVKEIRTRCRRIEIIADVDESGNLPAGSQKVLREYERVTIVDGIVVKREFAHNAMSTAAEMATLVAPNGITGVDVLTAFLWSNDLPQYIDPQPPVVEEPEPEPVETPFEEPPAEEPAA